MSQSFFERAEPAVPAGPPPPVDDAAEAIGRGAPAFRSAGLADDKEGWNRPWDSEPGEGMKAEPKGTPKPPADPTADPPPPAYEEPAAEPEAPIHAGPSSEDRLGRLEQGLNQVAQMLEPQNVQQFLSQAMNQQRQGTELNEEWRRRTSPPPLPTVEELMEKPELMHKALNDTVAWTKQLTEAYAAPIAQQAEMVGKVLGPIINTATATAWSAAREQAKRDGYAAEEFDGLARHADQLLIHNRAPAEATAARCDPQSVYTAFRMAHARSGRPAPVRGNTGAPPTVPRAGSGSAQNRTAKPAEILDVERRLGVKFNDSEVRQYLREREALR